VGSCFNYDCSTEFVEFKVFPWLNGNGTVTNFQGVLAQSLQTFLAQEDLTLNDCITNTLSTTWYVDLKLGNEQIIQYPFYQGDGLNDVPTNSLWKNSLADNLDNLYRYGLNYFLNGNTLNVTNMDCIPKNLQTQLTLNVGINISINCANGVV
jgi:hypothetical protein